MQKVPVRSQLALGPGQVSVPEGKRWCSTDGWPLLCGGEGGAARCNFLLVVVAVVLAAVLAAVMVLVVLLMACVG